MQFITFDVISSGISCNIFI